MMTLIIASLILGSVFGFHLLLNIIRVKPTQALSAIVHGFLVAVGLILLFVQQGKWSHGSIYSFSLILFIASTITGVALEFMTIENSALKSKIYSIVHTAVSILGLLLIVIWTINSNSWGM
jgi:hypothetical protein